MEYKISKVLTDENRPVIASFLNGDVEPIFPNPKTQLLRDPDNNIVVEVASENVLYKGKIADADTNTFLVLKKKNSNKVKLIQVDHAVLMPYIERSRNDISSVIFEKGATVSELNKQFGSKKAKRKTEQYERMKMDVEHAREHLEQTVADIEIEDSSLAMPKEEETENLYKPPINKNAGTKEQVYNVYKMVSKNVLDTLEDQAKEILESDNLEDFNIKPMTKKIILELQKSKSTAKVEKCKVLLYVDSLLSFLVTSAKQIATKTYKACTYNADVNKHILDNFTLTTGNSRSRPMSMRDKCICYILVFLVVTLDFRIDLEDIAKEIKVGLKKLQEYGRVLFFTTVGNTLVLKLPLPAPFVGNPKRKRR